MSIFLLILLAALVAGVVGVVVDGLLWVLAVAVIVALLDFVFLGARLRGRRRPAR